MQPSCLPIVDVSWDLKEELNLVNLTVASLEQVTINLLFAVQSKEKIDFACKP